MKTGIESSWLARRAVVSPGHPALIQSDQILSFRRLFDRSARRADEMRRVGIARGQRVGLLLDNGLLFAECLHALMEIGAVSVPLNDRLRPQEQRAQLEEACASRLLFDTSHSTPAEEIGGERVTQLGSDSEVRAGLLLPQSGSRTDISPGQISTDALHTIMFTSGTTGPGKGVQLTYANHWWNAFGSMLNLGNLESDVWLDSLSPSHVGGLAILLRSVLYGVPAMLHTRFDPEEVNAALDSGRVTVVSLVSTMLHRMLELRNYQPYPPSLRCILLGGGPMPTPLLEACMDARIPIAPTYGLTETASQAATLKPIELERRPGSAGRPLFAIDMRIEGDGDGRSPDDEGEILVRGPSVSQGYCNGRAADGFDGGWFHTGDAGSMDEEGYLYVLDRRTDRIVTGGENVYPTEVESVLEAHPAIYEAGVFGVEDIEWGQIVVAAVIARTPEVDKNDVLTHCRQRLAAFKCPKRIRLVDSLPRTGSGKLSRKDLRLQFADERVHAGAESDGSTI